jgi:hypothetical protein
LNELKDDIEKLPHDKQHILSKDEVVETIHNTLEEITKTSSQDKVRYLRNSLTKAFTADDISYSQKQHYLSTLKELTLGELELMREIYILPDPFDHSYQDTKSPFGINALAQVKQVHMIQLPRYSEYREPPNGDTLKDVECTPFKLEG